MFRNNAFDAIKGAPKKAKWRKEEEQDTGHEVMLGVPGPSKAGGK